ncbi:hypothetical protein NIES4075_73250 [Tolypothrix sp. NIES-4075]|nr:hypothetical protein NIES4075_73250 [Tolypothrix sp. NIES-4075]
MKDKKRKTSSFILHTSYFTLHTLGDITNVAFILQDAGRLPISTTLLGAENTEGGGRI